MTQTRRRTGYAISEDEIRSIIVHGDAEKLVLHARRIGRALKNAGLKVTQIRNIFGTVRRIEMRWNERGLDEQTGNTVRRQAMRQLLLLQPKLEYQARRQREVEGLRDVLIPAISLVDGDREHFTHFVEFFEAILAYHVAEGGRTT